MTSYLKQPRSILTNTHTPVQTLGTHCNNIAVTSLATIQPKGMPTRTPFRAYNIHRIFYAVTGPPRQGEATKYPLCSGNSKH